MVKIKTSLISLILLSLSLNAEVKEFHTRNELKKFSKSSFGGGSLLEIKNERIHTFIVDLSRTSGIRSTESYIFIKDKKSYKMIHKLPYIDITVRKFALFGNELISYIKRNKEEKIEAKIILKNHNKKINLMSSTS